MFSKQANASVADKEKKSLKTALRRAFTITELVIVIAVIAILAAVLIPTFTSLINRANQSADTQTVKNLNTILASEEAFGNRAETIDEALAQALEGGYKVENLTPTGEGYDIVWDQTNNRFALVDASGKKIYGDASTPDNISGQEYWKITDDASKASDNTFSWYLTEDALSSDGGTVESYTITSATSLNLSAFTELKTVTISDTATGEINLTTNSEDVEIVTGKTKSETAPTINLYGTAGTVGALSNNNSMMGGDFGMNSLHVFGFVDRILVKSGKVVAESGSTINEIMVTSNARALTNILEKAISIEIADNATVNCIATSYYDNLNNFYLNGQPTLKLLSVISGSIPASNIITDRYVQVFDDGIGTKEDPYIITQPFHFALITAYNFSDTYFKTNTVYFKLGADIELSSRHVTVLPYMNLDLAGHTLTLSISGDVDDGFHVQSNCQLTITGNGKIETLGTSQSDYIFSVLGTGKLIIENGTFIGGISVVQAQDSAVVEIYDGNFSVINKANDVYYVLNYLDSSATTAKITVYGGTFTNFDPSNPNEAEGVTMLPDSGYTVESTSDATNTYYTVVAA